MLFAIEVSFVSLSSSSVHAVFAGMFPLRLPFQNIALVRQLWIILSLALNQLLPLWTSADREKLSEEQEREVRAMLEQAFIVGKEVEGMAVYAAQQQQGQLAHEGQARGS